MMKKFLIVVSAFCLCFSLVAANAEAGVEASKDQKPYWSPINLAIGPFFLFGGALFCTPLGILAGGMYMGYHTFWATPLIAPLFMVDGAIHTATFGLLYDGRTGEDYVSWPLRKLLGDDDSDSGSYNGQQDSLKKQDEQENFEEEVARLKKSACEGDSSSMFHLGLTYYDHYQYLSNNLYIQERVTPAEPKGNEQEYRQKRKELLKIKDEALAWLDKAAKAGHQEAKKEYDFIVSQHDTWDD
ncbi:hypothetical protein IJS98_03000 [bacterium]|nr:hypothetical protein [bacterium]